MGGVLPAKTNLLDCELQTYIFVSNTPLATPIKATSEPSGVMEAGTVVVLEVAKVSP